MAGCMQKVRVESDWGDNAARDQTFSRILVVGLSPDASVRCDYESFQTTQLRSAAVNAKASCYMMPTTEPLTRESIERLVAEYDADAVLTTSLVQSAAGAVQSGSDDTRGEAMYKATGTGYETGYYGRYGYYGGYGAYGIPVVYAEFQTLPPITTIVGEVRIQTMLYATSDASLVYEMTTTASDLRSRDDALASVTAPIAERLRRDGLLR